MVKIYKGNITPEKDTIFVFGSNPHGRHGKGSAVIAVKQFGAKYGVGEGLVNNSYGIPTTDITNHRRPNVSRHDIIDSILKMYKCAEEYPDKQFKVAYRNSGSEKTLCGYSADQLSSMFIDAGKKYGCIPENVWFSQEWAHYFNY